MARKIVSNKPSPGTTDAVMPVNSIDGMNPARPEKDHQAEHAFDDLMRAEEHKQNPDLMKRVMKHAKKKKAHIQSIADLKRAYADKNVADDAEDAKDGGADEDQEQS